MVKVIKDLRAKQFKIAYAAPLLQFTLEVNDAQSRDDFEELKNMPKPTIPDIYDAWNGFELTDQHPIFMDINLSHFLDYPGDLVTPCKRGGGKYKHLAVSEGVSNKSMVKAVQREYLSDKQPGDMDARDPNKPDDLIYLMAQSKNKAEKMMIAETGGMVSSSSEDEEAPTHSSALQGTVDHGNFVPPFGFQSPAHNPGLSNSHKRHNTTFSHTPTKTHTQQANKIISLSRPEPLDDQTKSRLDKHGKRLKSLEDFKGTFMTKFNEKDGLRDQIQAAANSSKTASANLTNQLNKLKEKETTLDGALTRVRDLENAIKKIGSIDEVIKKVDSINGAMANTNLINDILIKSKDIDAVLEKSKTIDKTLANANSNELLAGEYREKIDDLIKRGGMQGIPALKDRDDEFYRKVKDKTIRANRIYSEALRIQRGRGELVVVFRTTRFYRHIDENFEFDMNGLQQIFGCSIRVSGARICSKSSRGEPRISCYIEPNLMSERARHTKVIEILRNRARGPMREHFIVHLKMPAMYDYSFDMLRLRNGLKAITTFGTTVFGFHYVLVEGYDDRIFIGCPILFFGLSDESLTAENIRKLAEKDKFAIAGSEIIELPEKWRFRRRPNTSTGYNPNRDPGSNNNIPNGAQASRGIDHGDSGSDHTLVDEHEKPVQVAEGEAQQQANDSVMIVSENVQPPKAVPQTSAPKSKEPARKSHEAQQASNAQNLDFSGQNQSFPKQYHDNPRGKGYGSRGGGSYPRWNQQQPQNYHHHQDSRFNGYQPRNQNNFNHQNDNGRYYNGRDQNYGEYNNYNPGQNRFGNGGNDRYQNYGDNGYFSDVGNYFNNGNDQNRGENHQSRKVYAEYPSEYA